MASAAPDVDYEKESAFTNKFAVGAILIGAGAFLLKYFQSPDAPPAETAALSDVQDSFWFLWMVLWGIYRLVQLVFGVAVVLLGVLVVRQRSLLYVPVPPGTERSTMENPLRFRSPQGWGLPFENLTIDTQDGTKLNAWLVYHPKEKCKDRVPYTLVYFHGNAGNIGHRLENIEKMHQNLFINILIVDYRGYGDSEDGSGPCEKGFMMDAIATYRWLAHRIRNPLEQDPTRMSLNRILLFGRSIGGAVAIVLNARLLRQRIEGVNGKKNEEPPLPLPAGLVLENTFTGLRDMAVTIFPFLRFLSPLLRSPLLFDEWKSAESLGYLAKHHQHWCCCLLSGKQDKIVPPIQMRQLHALLKEYRPKVLKFFIFEHGGHNDTWQMGGAAYWDSMKKFMSELEDSEAERLEAIEKAGWGVAS